MVNPCIVMAYWKLSIHELQKLEASEKIEVLSPE